MRLLYLLFAGCFAQTCTPVSCVQLDRYNCAARNQSQSIVSVNLYGCSGMGCLLSSYQNWMDGETSDVLQCDQLQNYVPNTGITTCDPQPLGDTLSNGDVFPVRCQSSADCQLDNGSFAACICGLDGNMYCAPGLGAEVFHGLWDLCQSSATGQINTADYEHYLMLQRYYVQYISAPSCARSIFSEFQALDAYSFAAYLLLTSLVVTLGV